MAALLQRQPVRALLAQLIGLAVAWVLAWSMPGIFHDVWALAITQGFAALFASRWLQQPRWWQPMHLAFLPAVVAATTLALPSELYLVAFALLLLVFWGTAGGDVPLFLSSREVMLALAEIADDERARRVVDLGAGVGSVVVPLAKHFPLLQVEAWERAPIPWAITALRTRGLTNLRLHRASFWQANLADYDVVFAFLSPAVMAEVGNKVKREMRRGALFVSSSFEVPGWRPEMKVEVGDAREAVLYCYRIEENMK
jgi:hypothetical protein